MSTPAELERLRRETDRYGTDAYLLSSGSDGRPHTVASPVRWQDGRLVAPAGSRTRSNVAGCPLVSLLWPPAEPGGYSLIVDADAVVEGDVVYARPTRAVLHRPGQASGLRPSCTSDCVPLLDP